MVVVMAAAFVMVVAVFPFPLFARHEDTLISEWR